jgi:hypothetical protein
MCAPFWEYRYAKTAWAIFMLCGMMNHAELERLTAVWKYSGYLAVNHETGSEHYFAGA